jgi:hypothetical protein
VVAGVGVSAGVTGGLGSAIVITEDVQRLYQFRESWIVYHASGEGPRREPYLYDASAGDYAFAASP